jgi:hypothetical protein
MTSKNYLATILTGSALAFTAIDADAQSRNAQVRSGIEQVVDEFDGFLRVGVPYPYKNAFVDTSNHRFSHTLLSLAEQIEECKDPVEKQRLINIRGGLLQSKELLVTSDYKIPEIRASLNPDTLFLSTPNINLKEGNYVLGFRDENNNIRELNLTEQGELNYFARLEQGPNGPMIIFNEDTPSGIAFDGYIASKEGTKYLDSVRLNVANGIDDLANSYNEEIFRLNNVNRELLADNESVRGQIVDITNYMSEFVTNKEQVLGDLSNRVDALEDKASRTNWGINASYDPQNEIFTGGINADMPSGILIKANYSTLARIANDNAQTFDLGINPMTGLPTTRELNENTNHKYSTGTLGFGSKIGNFLRAYADVGLTHGQTNTLTDQLTYDMLGANRLNVQQDQIKDTKGFSTLNVGATLGVDIGRLTLGGSVSYPVHDIHGQRPNNNLNYSANAQIRLGGGRR